MSQVTELASGQINSAWSITIELVRADEPGSRHRQVAVHPCCTLTGSQAGQASALSKSRDHRTEQAMVRDSLG